MTTEAWIVVAIIAAALILFVWEKLSIDLVAMLIIVATVVTGVLTPKEAIAGFSNPATLTVAFMFVISAAVLKTGVMQLWGPKFSANMQSSYRKGMLGMMLAVALCSAFINNTPVVAIFVPVILQVAKTTGIPASRMLIPMSFASILGGMTTLIGTSTNILVSGMLEDAGLGGVSMFEMTPVAIILVIGGALYFYFIGFNLLPNRGEEKSIRRDKAFQNYITEVELKEGFEEQGTTIMEASWIKDFDLDVIEVHRGEEVFTLPSGDMHLLVGDTLKLSCTLEKLKVLARHPFLKLIEGEVDQEDKHTSLVEMVVASDSSWEGKSLKQIDFRRSFRAAPLAIRHRSKVVQERVHEATLQAGDVILAQMKTHYAKQLRKREDRAGDPFILVSAENLIAFNKKAFALVAAILAVMVTVAAFGVPMIIAALCAVCLLVLTKQLNMKEMYRAVNWNIVFLIAGALSLGLAMSKTGLALFLAQSMIEVLGDSDPRWIMAALFVSTMLLTELMSNTASAALMAPLAISTSSEMGLSPMPFVIAIMFAASASFMTPIGYQTNTMVYAPGQYKFTDYTKAGVLLSLITAVLSIWLIPYFYGF